MYHHHHHIEGESSFAAEGKNRLSRFLNNFYQGLLCSNNNHKVRSSQIGCRVVVVKIWTPNKPPTKIGNETTAEGTTLAFFLNV